MKISKKFYLSLLIISVSLIIAYCLKIIFFPSNNKTLASTNNFVPEANRKSIFETNTKYLNEVYLEYKEISYKKNFVLTEKQFSNIFHCFLVISQLEFVDYGEMIIYILEKNPTLVKNLMFISIDDNFMDGFFRMFKPEDILFYDKPLHQKEDQSVFLSKFENIKSEIRNHCKDNKKLKSLNYLYDFRNDIKAIFNTTSLNYQYLENLIPLFDFYFSCNLFFNDNVIEMRPAIFYAIDYIKRNWTNNLSTDMINNVFSSEFITPKGTFSYFYISLYSWVYFNYDDYISNKLY